MNVLEALVHLFHAALISWPWGRCLLLRTAELAARAISNRISIEIAHLAPASVTNAIGIGDLRRLARDQAWPLFPNSGGTMELLLTVGAMALLFVSMWAMRRLVLPALTRQRPSRTSAPRAVDIRLISSGENALARRAVSVACVGSTAELQSIVKELTRRASLELADAGGGRKFFPDANDCPYCGTRASDRFRDGD